MKQTNRTIDVTEAVKQSEGTQQRPGLPYRLQRPGSFISSNFIFCILIGCAALGFSLYRLGNTGIWFDEAFSVELARQPLPLMWHIIWGPEPNMELYYLFLHFWLGLTGFLGLLPTEFVVRLPSAIFAALSSVMVFLLGRRFLGLTAAIVGASLYLLDFLQLVYAQQTRSYSLQLLLICISWYALFTLLTRDTNQKRWWACYIAATALGVYAHLFTLEILLAQVIAFAGLLILPGPWRHQARRRLVAFIVNLLAVVILIIPMLLVSRNGSKTGWLPAPQLHDVYSFFMIISAYSKIYLLIIFAVCALAIFTSLLAYLPQGEQLLELFALNTTADEKRQLVLRQSLPVVFALLCWLAVPVVLSYIVSQGSTRLFSARYLVAVVPPLFLLVGLGVSTLRWRAVRTALTLALIGIALYFVPAYYRSAQVEDWNSAVPWLQQHYQAGDGLVCYDSDVEQGCQISVEYYLHAYPTAAHFTGDSPGEFSWTNFGPANPRLGPESAVDPKALAAYAAKHPRIFYILGRIPNDAAAARAQAAQSWLNSHYHLIGRIVTPTVTVSLYTT